MNRRRFLTSVAARAGAMSSLPWAANADPKKISGIHIHRWFPQIRTPRKVWIVPTAWNVQEGMILESASGLAALAVQQGLWDTLIYEEDPSDGYQRWFAEFCKANSPELIKVSLDEAVTGLAKAKLVHGYILYLHEQSNRPLHCAGKLDESVNVATSLAGPNRGLIVSESLVARMEKLGIRQLLDVRDRSEKWCLSQHHFSRAVVGTADPKTRNVRSFMIALNAFVCSGRGEAYHEA